MPVSAEPKLSSGVYLTEFGVALTDYFIALVCAGFVWSLRKREVPSGTLSWTWIIFFGSLVIASVAGGTVHGFYLDESTLGFRILWPVTLLAIGVTATSAWILSGFFISGPTRTFKWVVFAGAALTLYAAAVLFYAQTFVLVILYYVPALLLLLVGSILKYSRTKRAHYLSITWGVCLSFCAAAIQQIEIGIHPVYFNHNSTYHLVQVFGLWAFFQGTKTLTDSQ
ncbi:MAG: hypothetical protein AB7O65_02510 [Candidatus Korobacteraceae bacterium]